MGLSYTLPVATIRRRKSKTRGTRYEVMVRIAGHPTSTATFDTLEEARRWGDEESDRLRSLSPGGGGRTTLSDALHRYTRTHLKRKAKATQSSQLPQLEWWQERLGSVQLRDLSSGMIAAARDDLETELSPATVNRYLAALSHVLTVCSREWGWVATNPARNVDRLQEPKGRVRFLTEKEIGNLLTECRSDPNLYALVLLALTTGMRRGELAGLTWDRVDLQRRVVWLEDTKNRERRGVPIGSEAVEALMALPRRIDGRVFPYDPESRIEIPGWGPALTRAKIKDFRFHDLRHTAASHMAMNGASPSEIAAVLGHKTLAMVKRYAHLAPEHLRTVTRSLSDRILGTSHGEGDTSDDGSG